MARGRWKGRATCWQAGGLALCGQSGVLLCAAKAVSHAVALSHKPSATPDQMSNQPICVAPGRSLPKGNSVHLLSEQPEPRPTCKLLALMYSHSRFTTCVRDMVRSPRKACMASDSLPPRPPPLLRLRLPLGLGSKGRGACMARQRGHDQGRQQMAAGSQGYTALGSLL